MINGIKILITSGLVLLASALSAQDECKTIGWANYDGEVNGVPNFVGAPTGGGSATPVEVTTFAELKSAAESSSAKVIYVKNSVGNGYLGKTGDVLLVKSNKTIIGYPGVTVKCSWQIKKVSNIIIRNMTLSGPGNSNANQNWDCVNIEGAKRIWFDHCTVIDGEDGNFDVVKGSDNISVTWCIFTYSADGAHNLSNLVGSSDSEPESHGKLNITYANCWWKNVNSRTPRTRYGKIHVLNCYYSNSGGTRAGFMANNRNEACYFENISEPIGLISDGGQAGIFPINCSFVGCSGNTAAVSVGGYTAFKPPYTYTVLPAKDVKSVITNTTCGAGPTMDSPTQCGCISTTPTLVLTSGSAAQTVTTGTAIAQIVYTWGGSATDVSVTGLPAGLTFAKNTTAKTLTIAGTPTATGTYTVKSVQSSGTALTLTGTVTVKIPIPQAPYSGTAAPIPGTIQFEDYDVGGNGFAYLDNAAGNTGGATIRMDEDVDIEACTDAGAGYNIGYAAAGEWLEYSVDVAAAGKYDLTLRVACNGDGRTISLQTDWTDIATDVAIPNTNGWQTWEEVVVNDIALSAGQQVIRVTIGASDYVNLNYMTFTAVAVAPALNIKLLAGWNLVGCPISGSTDIDKALSSIWPLVEAVKSPNAFYIKAYSPTFNLLNSLNWGEGYYVKVSADCDLDWIVK